MSVLSPEGLRCFVNQINKYLMIQKDTLTLKNTIILAVVLKGNMGKKAKMWWSAAA